MGKTDTSERWFEARVVRGLTGVPQPEYSHARDQRRLIL